jgi:hypothetical protein
MYALRWSMGVSGGVWDISDSRAPQWQHVIFYEQLIFVIFFYKLYSLNEFGLVVKDSRR